jgi:uncharacterized membrane protein
MSSSTGSFDLAALFAERGVDLATLGAAYLILIATAVLTVLAFYTARSQLVISPNRGSRDYGIYVSWALATLLIAIFLENESLPPGRNTLHYAFVPQIVALMSLHVWISYRLEPWLVTLGASAAAATIAVGALLGVTTGLVGPAYWVALSLLGVLLAFLWWKAISTQRAFVNASSIYLQSKETLGTASAPQKPWLGLPQWVGLIAASVGLGAANALLQGRAIEDLPAVEVAAQSGLLMAVTALVCAVPAGAYWFTRKTWMPELTRFVWLAWIVVGFALTYGNYLSSLVPA